MLKIILAGANGAMGKNVSELIETMDNVSIVAGIDRHPNERDTFPYFETIESCTVDADCIIDFSHASIVPSLLHFAGDHKMPIVVCTTGLSEETEKLLMQTAQKTAVFKSGNMSLGINVLIALAQKTASLLEDQFDIEIIEKHHHRKVDAPSGTAKMIANGINHAIESPKKLVYGRYGNDSKRTPDEMTIHAVRGGSIVGEHEVIFAGIDEVIEIKHTAQSRLVFAKGAVSAAKYLIHQSEGLYNMDSLLEGVL